MVAVGDYMVGVAHPRPGGGRVRGGGGYLVGVDVHEAHVAGDALERVGVGARAAGAVALQEAPLHVHPPRQRPQRRPHVALGRKRPPHRRRLLLLPVARPQDQVRRLRPVPLPANETVKQNPCILSCRPAGDSRPCYR